MSIASPLGVDSAPFTSGGLDALLIATAQDCPAAPLCRDDDGVSTAADIARRMRRLAAAFARAGLRPGERILVAAGAQTCALVAIAAALRAGIEPAVVPCHLKPVDLAARATAANAVALIGPSVYGEVELGEAFLSTAALCDGVRVIATQGPEPVDGALDVSFSALDLQPSGETDDDEPAREPPMIGTFQGPAATPRLLLHRQAVLLADALSLVEQARINPSKPILATLPPASLAGLVAGPFAALIGASGIVWHGPFDSTRFLAACDAEPGSHLVAPAVLGPTFAQPAFMASIGSLILVSRFADAGAFALPQPVACEHPVVDVYGFGEETILAQRRIDGTARAPTRVADKSLSGGLGARLNRARAAAPRAADEPLRP